MYIFSQKSLKKLENVHPDLVKVVKHALTISTCDFMVLEGVRSFEQQKLNVKTGVSKTFNSKHLIQSDGYSHAVDLIPYPVSWKLDKFYPIAEAIKKSAEELNVKIRWGGCWCTINNSPDSCLQLCLNYSKARKRAGNSVFIDAPHFELIK